jgi:hypothetical protein
MKIAAVLLAALAPLCAQDVKPEIKLPASLDKLAAKAEESVDVTLDGNMLRLAARFLSDKDSDEARAKKAISGLQSVAVRSFQFAGAGEYDPADLNAVRSQFQPPAWSRIVGAKSKATGEDLDVYFKIDDRGQLGGVFIIDAEPRELTIVNITGVLDPEHLADLGGQFHIPAIDLAFRDKRSRSPK